MKLPDYLEHELPVLQKRVLPPAMKPFRYGPNNQPPGRGRKRGAINKITTDLKHGILKGAANCGYDGEGLGGVEGFLAMCAQRYPKHYLALLGKMLPMNLNANAPSAAIQTVQIVSVPSGVFLNREQMALAEQGKPFTIDYDEPAPREELAEPAPPEVPAPVQEDEEPTTPEEAALLARMAALSLEDIKRLLDAIQGEPAKAHASVKYEHSALHLPQQPIPPSGTQRPRW